MKRRTAYRGLKLERRKGSRWHIRNFWVENLGFKTLVDARWFIDTLRANKPGKAREQSAWIRRMRERSVKQGRCVLVECGK